MKKRLIKFAENNNAQNQALSTASATGKQILKDLEQWKYELNQCKGILTNLQDGDKLAQDFDIADTLMSGIYSICYNLDNFNIIPNTPYDIDQINVSEQNDGTDFSLEDEPLEEMEDVENPPPPEQPQDENTENNNEDDMSDNGDMGMEDFNFG